MSVSVYNITGKMGSKTPPKRSARVRRSDEYRVEKLPDKALAILILGPLFVGVIFLVLLSYT